MGKSIFTSKTFWFNALALIVLVANGFGFADFQHDAQLDVYASLVISVANLILRLATNQPIAFKSR